ncbi:hypothetical protein CYMTET_8698 [Cymbomonas tetramitiformis]|uniref:Uncharacterized protein n=1 Tax=Cymbomonas tetramitiformis TaxID=36881 RepID=A0AAE0LG87_9CHLO|nr:hypothetical protein CYMTET_8698 [Cymbomonas tetramitiformis]
MVLPQGPWDSSHWVSAHLIRALRDCSTSHNSGGRFKENLRTARHAASRSKTLTAVWCTVADPTQWTTSTPTAQDAIPCVALAAAPVAAAIATAVVCSRCHEPGAHGQGVTDTSAYALAHTMLSVLNPFAHMVEAVTSPTVTMLVGDTSREAA